MIVSCNQGCRKSDGFTNGSLDVESGEVICNECGEDLSSISEYAKLAMRANGDIIRSKKKKAFMFPCNTCDIDVEAQFVSGVLVGKACPKGGTGCRINTTEHMVKAIEETQRVQEATSDLDAE